MDGLESSFNKRELPTPWDFYAHHHQPRLLALRAFSEGREVCAFTHCSVFEVEALWGAKERGDVPPIQFQGSPH